MVVIPLVNGMLSDGLMLRSMDVMSRIMLGASPVKLFAVFFQEIAVFELKSISPPADTGITNTPACTICIAPVSIPPSKKLVPLVIVSPVALKVNTSVKV